MSPDIVSLLILGVVVAVGCFSRLNVGVLSFLLAFGFGQFVSGASVAEVAQGFPAQLFLRLTGITLLFSLAGVNGTLTQIAWRTVGLVRADPRLTTPLIFGLAVTLASSGAGNFATTAMLAPVAMGVARQLGISGFLMAVMLVNGASAGAFSPIAPTGIVARELMGRMGLGGHEWALFLNSLAAHAVVALIAYFLLGGLGRPLRKAAPQDHGLERGAGASGTMNRAQVFTTAVILAFAVNAVVFRLEVSVAAFAGAALIILAGAADEASAFKSVPWGVILMVCGVTMLMSVVDTAGGIGLVARFLAQFVSAAYLPGLIALVAGLVSIYASSIGVVMPALLPSVPALLTSFGGGNSLMIAFSINVGAHLVDISPLSPLGAMCLAYAPPGEDRVVLFRKLMVAGWVMAPVGFLVCQLMFGYR